MFDQTTTFEVSTNNIIPEGRRSIDSNQEVTNINTIPEVTLPEINLENTIMADNQVVTIVGDLVMLKDELLECLDTDLEDVSALTEFDALKKEVKALKANILKSTTKLKYLKSDEDVTEYADLVQQAKDFLLKMEKLRKEFIVKETKQRDDTTFKHINVLKNSLDSTVSSCKIQFTVDLNTLDDGELILVNDNMANIREKFNDLRKLYFEFIEKCPHNYPQKDVLFSNYDTEMKNTEKLKTDYESDITKEMHKRELTRNKIQNIKNEISLPQYSGYHSELDFYNFKSRFLNKYRRYTSRDMIDILKNTYLRGEAHNTVKELESLDEIWDRLRNDFGNPSRMLKNKLTTLASTAFFGKAKGTSAKSELVLKTINLLSDIFKLAEEHDLNLELYCKNEKVLGLMLKQLPRLWLHDWQAFKKSSKKEIEEKIKNAPAWKEDQLYWELYKKYLEEKLVDLKDEEEMEETLKEVSIEEEKNRSAKAGSSKSFYASESQRNIYEDENDFYDYEDFEDSSNLMYQTTASGSNLCKLCSSTGHSHYWDCKEFMKFNHGERFELFVNPRKNGNSKSHVGKLLGECAACLVPGTKFGHNCEEYDSVKKWLCKSTHKKPVHILCCRHHVDENRNTWEDFHYNTKAGFMQGEERIPLWKREVKWMVHVANPTNNTSSISFQMPNDKSITIEKPVKDEAIFLFQKVVIDSNTYNIFYDSGCGDFCVSKSAVNKLKDRATMLRSGPFTLTGVSNMKCTIEHGVYQVQLPLANGNEALFAGLCMDEVTAKFCEYDVVPLYNVLAQDFTKCGGIINDFPKICPSGKCGGNTDIMIGIKYNRYQPKKIHELDSGLAIYRSAFAGKDGSTAVIGGPHPLISEIESKFAQNNHGITGKCVQSYFSSQLKMYLDGYDISPDLRLCNSEERIHEAGYYPVKSFSKFMGCEDAGTVASYRCVRCRNCKECKCGPQLEEVSRKEEYEQHLINESVYFDEKERRIECVLPLLDDPAKVLGNNKGNACKVYHRWISKINKNPDDLDSIIKSEQKLQARGHVAFVKDLDPEQQNKIKLSPAKYFLPWRPVWNENSLTTPCRLTFDASDKTSTGYSLNDILPKGMNHINSLLEIIISWRNGKFAMASDIEQMYNGIKLNEKHWPLQMYLWNNKLTIGVEPEIKVIKTATYGVRSSGNQATVGVRLAAVHSENKYPDASKTLKKSSYVDDVLPPGKESLEQCYVLADQLNIIVEKGGLKLKCFAFSYIPPDSSISSDGCTVDIAGMKWNTIEDAIALKMSAINFGKKYRGKKPNQPECFKVPTKLTKRICTSIVGEVWDLLGLVVPITARLKLDLHDTRIRKLDWDDEIPGELRKLWTENFEIIEQLQDVRFTRATVPPDAIDLNMELIEAGDASGSLICVGVYVRFKRACGQYSSELVVGKSKVVPDGMSVPRAELYAAEVNSILGEVVMRAFVNNVVKRVKITDSKVAYYWINSWEKPLKLWTRNRVNEILRWSTVEDWYWCSSSDMPCDIGTRRNATINDVGNKSGWKEGLNWMRKDSSEFPLKTLEEIKLKSEEEVAFKKEMAPASHAFPTTVKPISISEKIGQRLNFSKYIVHPNKFRFRSVVRILALVFKFLLKFSVHLDRKLFKMTDEYRNLKHFPTLSNYGESPDMLCQVNVGKADKPKEEIDTVDVILDEKEIDLALRYFYQKATVEIEKFGSHTKAYRNSKVVDGIRYYTGRLLTSQSFKNPELHPMSSVMSDLCSTSFCVPIVDQYSPIAWSLTYEIHWYDNLVSHSGAAATSRRVKEYAYVVGVKDIAESFRKFCGKCRLMAKKTIDVGFGPLSEYQLNIAPAFYVTQVDLMGPYRAYQINVRANLKIWFAVFVCVVTSTVDIQVMEFYSSGSFISAFIRFSSYNGYPKVLLPDQGSNIESAIDNVEIDWIDVKGRLNKSYGVDMNTCGVGGHHQHGKVERKIRQIKETYQKSFHNERLSVLQWQTVATETANCINNLPIGTGSSRNINLELDDLDIITPNRLRFGRNNERSPLGPAYISHDPFKFIDINQRIFESWWEHWLLYAVPELIEKPVFWKEGKNLTPGDVVLFRKSEGSMGAGTYQYGIVHEVSFSQDNVVRNVLIKYRNVDEGKDRITKRAVKSLILIHTVK